MKVIITGSTGMVGNLILDICLHSDKIREVVSFVRKPSGKSRNQKLKEVVISDFENYSEYTIYFQNVSSAFFNRFSCVLIASCFSFSSSAFRLLAFFASRNTEIL